MHSIMDFLTDRRFLVEIEGFRSSLHSLRIGCVQGSVLGPKLFNVYMHKLTETLSGAFVTSYADEPNVLVTGVNC